MAKVKNTDLKRKKAAYARQLSDSSHEKDQDDRH